jgi:hypothetical protein
VAKFTTLTPLSIVISCKLSFPIVGLTTINSLEIYNGQKVKGANR